MVDPRRNKKYKVGVLVVETGDIYNTRKDCARALNASPQLVSNCLTGYTETCKGYHLEYADIDCEAELMADTLNDIERQKPLGCTWSTHPRFKDVIISDDGQALSFRNGKWDKLKASPGARGYRTSYVEGKNRLLHILVAETFIPNPDNKPWVNHEDGNKANNKASNLTWSTPSENELHAYRTGLKKGHHKGRPIRVVETGVVYPSIKACADDIGCNGPEISRCLSGLRTTCRGYHFEYVDKEAYRNGDY